MIRKKQPEKKFIVKYVPCVSSATLCPTCNGKGEVEKETGGPGHCPKCSGAGFLAYVWEIHVAA